MMVIYIPVKYGWMDRQTDKNGQTNTRNYTNFERNLAMMVMYVPVKFEFDWTVFQLESGNKNVDKQMDGHTNGQKTDKRTDGISPISKGT